VRCEERRGEWENGRKRENIDVWNRIESNNLII